MLDAMLASAKQAVQEKDENLLSVLTPEHIVINMWLMFFAGKLLCTKGYANAICINQSYCILLHTSCQLIRKC